VFVAETLIALFWLFGRLCLRQSGQSQGCRALHCRGSLHAVNALVWRLGCFAGYLSCIFMGLYLGYSPAFVMIWAPADFFEGFVPLLIYRSLKTKPALQLNRPKMTYDLNVSLTIDLIGSGAALVLSYSAVFVTTFVVGIALLAVQASVEEHKTWITRLIAGVFLASSVSGVFGVGALVAFGNVLQSAFPTVFAVCVFGYMIVPATLGTILTVALTPLIIRSQVYVRRVFS